VRRTVKSGERSETVASHLHVDPAKLIDQRGRTEVLEDQEKVVILVTARKEAFRCSNRDLRGQELVEGDLSFVEALERCGRATYRVERGDFGDETRRPGVAALDLEAIAVRHLAVTNARGRDLRDVAQRQVLREPARVNLVNRRHSRHAIPRSVCPRLGRFVRARCSDKNGPMQSFIQHYGYYALFALSVLSSACIPIPSEVAYGFAGALCTAAVTGHVRFTLWGVILVGTIGSLVGAIIAYEIGRSAGRTIVDRWGKWILVTHKDLDRGERWFEEVRRRLGADQPGPAGRPQFHLGARGYGRDESSALCGAHDHWFCGVGRATRGPRLRRREELESREWRLQDGGVSHHRDRRAGLGLRTLAPDPLGSSRQRT